MPWRSPPESLPTVEFDGDADAAEADHVEQDLLGDLLLALDVDEAEAVGDLPADEKIAPQRLLLGERLVLVDGLDREIVRHAHRIVARLDFAVADEDFSRVGGRTPVITLIRVDLPAPLSPMSPTISLRPMAMSMSRRAWTAPKYFCTPSMRTIEAKSGRGRILDPSAGNPATSAVPHTIWSLPNSRALAMGPVAAGGPGAARPGFRQDSARRIVGCGRRPRRGGVHPPSKDGRSHERPTDPALQPSSRGGRRPPWRSRGMQGALRRPGSRRLALVGPVHSPS